MVRGEKGTFEFMDGRAGKKYVHCSPFEVSCTCVVVGAGLDISNFIFQKWYVP